jgi:hypothetical protein
VVPKPELRCVVTNTISPNRRRVADESNRVESMYD